MQENFEGYREELDQVKLTEESKRALVRSLQNWKESEMRKNGRKPVRIRRMAAVAAVMILAWFCVRESFLRGAVTGKGW